MTCTGAVQCLSSYLAKSNHMLVLISVLALWPHHSVQTMYIPGEDVHSL